jgi:hypothetical protein
MKKLTSVIIKGNPKFIENNLKAEMFYQRIKKFLESLEYEVTFDNGDPYTSPKKADLWIGHSRGVDRLRFSPKKTKTIMFGSSHIESINHHLDNSTKITYPSDIVPNKFHYIFTYKMKKSILDITKM